MRVLKILLISCFMLVAAQSFAFAGSGKAIVPHWFSYDDMGRGTPECIYITNISNHDLIVKISAYKQDSTIVTPTYYNFKNNNTEIGAGETARIEIQDTVNYQGMGYAIIEWKNNNGEDDTVGLVASLVNYPINMGNPF